MGIRRQDAASVNCLMFMTRKVRRRHQAWERSNQNQTRGYTLRRVTGTSFPSTVSEPSLSCPPPPFHSGTLPDSRSAFSSFFRLFQSTLLSLLFVPDLNQPRHGLLQSTSAHLTSFAPPPPFSIPHDLVNLSHPLFLMATHGPINGVKINRACSGSFAPHMFPLPLPLLFPSVRAHRVLIPFLVMPSPNPQSIAVRHRHPPPCAGLRHC